MTIRWYNVPGEGGKRNTQQSEHEQQPRDSPEQLALLPLSRLTLGLPRRRTPVAGEMMAESQEAGPELKIVKDKDGPRYIKRKLLLFRDSFLCFPSFV